MAKRLPAKTATRRKRVTCYSTDAWLYELSKAIRPQVNFVLITEQDNSLGRNCVNIWLSNEEGEIVRVSPIVKVYRRSIKSALKFLGYTELNEINIHKQGTPAKIRRLART